jgi:hypothetical protein
MSVAAIKIKVTIAQPFVIAGTPFSLTTTIENVHEEKIEVLRLTFHIPYQMQWINDSRFDQEYEAARNHRWLRRLLPSSILRKTAQPPGQAMTLTYAAPPKIGVAETNAGDENLIPTNKIQERAIFEVLPAESVSYSFKAVASNWLLMSGGDLSFPGLIKYRHKEEIHFSPFEVRLTLRPPLLSNCLGAGVGSVAGFVARTLQREQTTAAALLTVAHISGAILALILSVIAVVYSSRRTGESQPILTVEDFWGGLVIGFMIAYLGQEYFQKIVPIT